jgi:hypothetical protein
VLRQVIWGSILVFATTVVHTGCTGAALHSLYVLHPERWRTRRYFTATIIVSALVLLMFLASVLESLLWAQAYLRTGAIEGLEKALYFSIVTYTTLGYGDITLNEDWRLLASFEAANGIIMFGWTTALIVAFVQRLSSPFKAEEQGAEGGR